MKEQQDWHIDALTLKLQEKFKQLAEKHGGISGSLKDAVDQPGSATNDPSDDHRVTVQADKAIDFLTVKKVMMTLTDAGASEINFAVIRDEDKVTQ